jgi:MOSC domain-containing protein YiiM
MSIVRPIDITGSVAALLVNPDEKSGIESEAVDRVVARFEGLEGDRHWGATRPACVRVIRQYKKGTPIRNVRQFSIVSSEELAEIAAAMSIPAIRPEWLGANILVTGIPDLTLLPPASRLLFSSGAVLTTDTENAPCRFPAEVIERHHPGAGESFVKCAQHKSAAKAALSPLLRVALDCWAAGRAR